MKNMFVDIDTQIDFIMPDGNLYVKGAEKLIPNFKRLMDIAVKNNIPVLSSVDAHDEKDKEFSYFPPHCIKGHHGWKKVPETLQSSRINIENRPMSVDETEGIAQIIVEKTEFSMFANPNVDAILEKIKPDRVFVYGVATDYCVKEAAMGLVQRGYETYVIEDAIAGVSPETSKKAIDEMKAGGVKFITISEVEKILNL